MFQNIDNNEEEYINEEKKSRLNIKNLFQAKYIFLYIISFMVSTVSFNGEWAPFGLAIFAACCSNRKPVGLIYILVTIGTLIKFGFGGLGTFLITSILFMGLVLIIRPNFEEDERNEKQKLGRYVFISVFVAQALKMIFTGFLFYDLVTSVAIGLITYIFYKIFANSLIVISEYTEKQAFSIEEVMGASLLVSIAFVSLNGLKFWGLSVTNILSVMLVLFLGWKHGMLVGATSGITIGMVLGIITANSPILVAAYAISGMIAGLLNKLGKPGVIVGFCVGNAVLTYVANGNTVPIITIREILVASLGLLAIPKDVKINIEDIIPQVKCFPVTAGVLEGETVQKLNGVSETIAQMANSYNESAKDVLETKDLEDENKELFLDDLSNNFEDLEENIFYDDLIENENISEDIYDELIKNNEMTEECLINILSNNENCKIAVDTDEAKQNIAEVVKVINATYRIHKLNILWKVKEANNKRVLATQLGGVSKVISSIAEDIDEKNGDSKEEKKEEKYKLSKVVLTETKNKSEISGDNNLIVKLEDGKYMLAISDGMGSGTQANKSSNTVISMLKKMLTNGFDKEVSIGLINSAININSNEETYATIDLSIVDLNNGNIEFVKNGACPTFIKSKNKVEVVKAVSFPAGVLDKIDLVVYDKDLKPEDIIIMCSDGILESNTEYENKEIWLKNLLENIETTDIEKIANIIKQEAIDNGLGIAKDDMTVIVAKLEKKL